MNHAGRVLTPAAMAWLAACACAPRDPWDDPDFVRNVNIRAIPIEEFEAHYHQIARLHAPLGCGNAGRFYDEPHRPRAVPLILEQIRVATQPEACARHTASTFYRVCDVLCSSDSDLAMFDPCDEAALAPLPEGCQWIGWEAAPAPGRSPAPGARWLDGPFPWRPGLPWETRHPPEIAQHYAADADVQAILRAHDAANTPR